MPIFLGAMKETKAKSIYSERDAYLFTSTTTTTTVLWLSGFSPGLCR